MVYNPTDSQRGPATLSLARPAHIRHLQSLINSLDALALRSTGRTSLVRPSIPGEWWPDAVLGNCCVLVSLTKYGHVAKTPLPFAVATKRNGILTVSAGQPVRFIRAEVGQDYALLWGKVSSDGRTLYSEHTKEMDAALVLQAKHPELWATYAMWGEAATCAALGDTPQETRCRLFRHISPGISRTATGRLVATRGKRPLWYAGFQAEGVR